MPLEYLLWFGDTVLFEGAADAAPTEYREVIARNARWLQRFYRHLVPHRIEPEAGRAVFEYAKDSGYVGENLVG